MLPEYEWLLVAAEDWQACERSLDLEVIENVLLLASQSSYSYNRGTEN